MVRRRGRGCIVTRRSGFVGYVDARADRLAVEQASSARNAAREAAAAQREAAAAADRARIAAQRRTPRPNAASRVQPAVSPVSGAHSATQRSGASLPRVVVDGVPITDPHAVALLSRF